jgi:hypothetical protein
MSHVHRQAVARAQAARAASTPAPTAAPTSSGGWGIMSALSSAAGYAGAGLSSAAGYAGAGLGAVGSGLGAAAGYLSGAGAGEDESSFEGEAEDVAKGLFGSDGADAHQAGDQSLFDDEPQSIASFLPKLSAKGEAENVGQAVRTGDDKNHLDTLQTRRAAELGVSVGAEGLDASAELGASGAMFAGHAEGDKRLNSFARLKGEADASMLSATAEAKGQLKAGWDGVSAQGEAGIGAYAGRATGKAEGGFRLPFTNVELYGGAEGEAAAGVGASAKGSLAYGAEGLRIGGRAGVTAGIGGALGLFGGVRKADASKGWW